MPDCCHVSHLVRYGIIDSNLALKLWRLYRLCSLVEDVCKASTIRNLQLFLILLESALFGTNLTLRDIQQ